MTCRLKSAKFFRRKKPAKQPRLTNLVHLHQMTYMSVSRQLPDNEHDGNNNNDSEHLLFDFSTLKESITSFLDELTTFQRWFETTLDTVKDDIVELRRAELLAETFSCLSNANQHCVIFLAYLYSRMSENLNNNTGFGPKENTSYDNQSCPTMLFRPILQVISFSAWEILKFSNKHPSSSHFYGSVQNQDTMQLLRSLCTQVEDIVEKTPDNFYVEVTNTVDILIRKRFDALVFVIERDAPWISRTYYLGPNCGIKLAKEPHLPPSKFIERIIEITFQSVWNVFQKEFSITLHHLKYVEDLIAEKKDKETHRELAKNKKLMSTLYHLHTMYCKSQDKMNDVLTKCNTDILSHCKQLIKRVEPLCTCNKPLHFETKVCR